MLGCDAEGKEKPRERLGAAVGIGRCLMPKPYLQMPKTMAMTCGNAESLITIGGATLTGYTTTKEEFWMFFV